MSSDVNNSGYVPMRRGIIKHLQDGSLTLNEYIVFTLLLMLADHKTGCGLINAAGIAYWTGAQMGIDGADRALRSLDKKDYIVREIMRGKERLYPYRVQNFEIFWRDERGVNHVRRTRFDRITNKVEEIDELLETFGAMPAEEGAEAPAVVGAVETAVVGADVTTRDKEQGTRNTDSLSHLSHSSVPETLTPSSGLRIAQPYVPGSKPNGQTLTSVPVADAMNLVDQFKDKSKHWKFGQKGSKAACAEAFVELLAVHSEAEISDVIDYAAEHEMYGTAMRTISKKEDSPWRWFVKTYDEIKAHMDNDAEYAKRVAARITKKKEAIKTAVETLTGAAEKDPFIVEKKHDDGSVTKEIKRKAKTKEENDLLLEWMQRPKANVGQIRQFLMEEA